VTEERLAERSHAAKVVDLVRRHGLATTAGVIASVVEDLHVRTFDRRYGVATSGYIPLAQTSLGADAERRGHRYRAVNAWAFRHVLQAIAPHPIGRFVDLGCGFGRACLIAARHGFTRVRGVDMVPEFCAQARRNLQAFAAHAPRCVDVEILLSDAVDYSRSADDDVVFLYNPFPAHVLASVVDNLVEGARAGRRDLMLIYTERVLETSQTLAVIEARSMLAPIYRHASWGQAFHVFRSVEP
jgi:SAM-dependent methyltransferase